MMEMNSSFTFKKKTLKSCLCNNLRPIYVSPLCVCEQIFEFCGADAKKLAAKIKELM